MPLVFAVGPADGFSEAALAGAAYNYLGKITLHELARAVLLEQIYRAFTILKGTLIIPAIIIQQSKTRGAAIATFADLPSIEGPRESYQFEKRRLQYQSDKIKLIRE